MKLKYLLQLGLAFTLIFAGVDSLRNTADWVGFVPVWIEHFRISRELLLHVHAVTEIILGLWLISGWQLRLAAAITALDILGIILANGLSRTIFLITFRDVGLFFMALYLAWPEDRIERSLLWP